MSKVILKYAIVFVISLLKIINSTLAQEQIHSVKDLPRSYLIKVKQLSEFIDRFNFQKDFLNRDIGPEFESIITRNDYVRLLFNNEDNRLEPGIEDDTYQILVDMFLHEVCADSVYIDRYSENIFAELTCLVNIRGKDEYIKLLLRQESNHGLKWAIISVDKYFSRKTESQRYMPGDRDKGESKNYIPPLSNEINFMDLKALLYDHENLHNLSANDCVREKLMGFYDMIRNGSLQYQHVKSIHYHILDIPGWVLVISNFYRNTDNSGWLIADLLLEDDISDYFYEKYAYRPTGSSRD